MLVDLGRNDLSRVCVPGTVRVERFMEPERYSHVTHLVSEVVGELRDGVTPFELLRACFPAGTVSRRAEGARDADHLASSRATGAASTPARSATCFPEQREIDTCIAIRTLVLRDGVAYLQAGGGIVADSDPAAEHQECLDKLRRARGGDRPRGGGAPMILLIDNYDSFTYNLAHLFGALGDEVTVRAQRRDRRGRGGALAPSHLVVSPGPGRPADAGASRAILERLAPDDADARRLPRPPGDRRGLRRRGRLRARARARQGEPVRHDGNGHLRRAAASRSTRAATTRSPRRGCPDVLEPTAYADDGEVMAVRHRELPVGRRPVPSRVGAHARRARRSRATSCEGSLDDPGARSRALLDGHDLTRDEAREAMNEIMRGDATPAQIAGFLVALRAKGETADEIAGCAEAMREHVAPRAARSARTSSTSSAPAATAQNTYNISTAAALVAAAAGAAIAKHGNRAASSATGSADVLEALGFRARARAGADRAVDRRARLRLPVRAGAPPGDAARRARPARARDAYGVQRARPAHEPCRRARAGARRLLAGARRARSPRRSSSSARRARTSSTAPAASTSSRRAARTSSARSTTARSREYELDPLDLGDRRAAPGELRGGDPGDERRARCATCSQGADGGHRSAVLLNAAGGDRRRGPRRGPARGARARARGDRLRRRRRAARRARGVLAGGAADEVRRRARAARGSRAIAEVKRRSPSAGDIRPDADVDGARRRRTPAPARRAISVLVDERFGGTIDDLARRARRRPTRRCSRKGFFSTEEQLRELREAGADAVLLHPARPRRRDDRAAARATRTSSASTRSSRRTTPTSCSARSRSTRRSSASTRATSRPSRSTATRSSSSSRARRATAIVIAESGVHTRAQGAAAELAGADAILVGIGADAGARPGREAARAALPPAREGLRADAPGGRRRRGRGGRRPARLHLRGREPAPRTGGARRARHGAVGGRLRRRRGGDATPISSSSIPTTAARCAAATRCSCARASEVATRARPALGGRATRRTGARAPRPKGASCSRAGSARRTSRDAIAAVRPWAVDAASSLEREPGVKDHARVRAYVEAARTMSTSALRHLRRPLRPRDADPGARRARARLARGARRRRRSTRSCTTSLTTYAGRPTPLTLARALRARASGSTSSARICCTRARTS